MGEMCITGNDIETPLTNEQTHSEDFHFVMLAGAVPSWFRQGLGIWAFRCYLACLMPSTQGTGTGQMFSCSSAPFPVLDCTEVAAHTQMHVHLLFPEKLAPWSCSPWKYCPAVSHRGTDDRDLNRALPMCQKST